MRLLNQNNDMRLIFISIALLLVSWCVPAQSPDDFFNRAANEYIYKTDKVALNTIDAGLQRYPGDIPLTNLKDKIEKEKEQEKQDQQQNQQQQNQEEQKNEEEQEQQQQNQEQQEQAEEGEESEEKDQSQEPQQQETEEEGKEMEKPPQSRSEKLEELNLTEEKARMILEAMKNNEIQYIQQNKRKAKKKPDSNKPDW